VANPQRPDEPVVEIGADFDLVRPRMARDIRAPGVGVLDVGQVVDHLVARKQLTVIVAAVDTRDEAVDASPDVDGIVHDLPVMNDAACSPRRPGLAAK
jgi:hypothetical protein